MGVGLRDASLNLRISRHQIAEAGVSLRQFSQSPKWKTRQNREQFNFKKEIHKTIVAKFLQQQP